MAVAASNLTSNTAAESAVDATSYTPAAAGVVPSANALLVATVANTKASSPDAVNNFSGWSLTWTIIGSSVTWDSIATPTKRITWYSAMTTGTPPSAGQPTADFGGATQTGCIVQVTEFTGVDLSGGSAAAIVQAVAGSDDNTGATGLTITLAAFGSANNATYGAVLHEENAAATVGSGFTLVRNLTCTTAPVQSLCAEFRADNDTSVDWTWTTGRGRGVAMEIKAAVDDGFGINGVRSGVGRWRRPAALLGG